MAELYCRNCGQPLRDTDNFCPKCGTRVERDETEEQAPVSGSAPFKPQTQAEEGIPSGQNSAPQIAEAQPSSVSGDISGTEEIRKNHEAFHIDDFDWGNSDYPTGHPHKTQDVDFNWHAAPVPGESRPSADHRKQEAMETSQEPAEAESDVSDSTGIHEEPAAPAESIHEEPEPEIDAQRMEHDLDAIDTFYTYSQKNEEFQKVLNKEYDRIRKDAPAGVSKHLDDSRSAEPYSEPEASPEETLHKLEELAKKAQSVTAASSRAAEAASEMYSTDEQDDAGERNEESNSADRADGQGNESLKKPSEEEKRAAMRERAATVQDVLDSQDAAADPEKSGHAGGAAEPASSGADMDYVFNPAEETAAAAKKKKKHRRHIGLKIFVAIVIVLIIVEAGFLILRRFAPDSAISIQLEKFFMHIADVIYSHFG